MSKTYIGLTTEMPDVDYKPGEWPNADSEPECGWGTLPDYQNGPEWEANCLKMLRYLKEHGVIYGKPRSFVRNPNYRYYEPGLLVVGDVTHYENGTVIETESLEGATIRLIESGELKGRLVQFKRLVEALEDRWCR